MMTDSVILARINYSRQRTFKSKIDVVYPKTFIGHTNNTCDYFQEEILFQSEISMEETDESNIRKN